MIKLFEHNQIAYDALCTMLAETGKAAVIHPTGTGKSFIAFKLAEEHPQRQFCWLSPSEHIFQTQLENVEQASGFKPENIRFLTYAKLMLMKEAEIAELKPEFIVLDEFHRCGAEEWGKGVQTLISLYSDAKLIGLTATSIRYLDNQRDMANELFDGCVAHQMTLGEAIVRGCLPAPKYIVSYYSCQKDMERYVRRARRAGAAAQQAADRYLEKLRRMTEQADGLDRIFEKHMHEKDGKYIVFCSDHEHMQSILPHIREWFSKVDEKPHVYQVYAYSPNARKDFQAFKADHSSHLKLLLCIDMLNEGIHVEDLSGVILFRPTVSPIIYKQQIGRALSAVKGRTPVIFDLVNNVDNLYSISAIRQEMDEIIRFFRNESRDEQIIQDGFELIDEVRDWRELFEQLEETLSAPWELMYQQARAYYEANGHLNVPRRYKTEDELGLGSWIHTQRNIRRGVCAGRLTEERIKLLDGIGMIWESVRDLAWEEGYEHALAYFHQHGNLDVPSRYASEDGYLLGSWITNMRSMYNGVRTRGSLSDERISQLESLGMIWNRLDFGFEQGYLAAARYAAQYGHLDVPVKYVDEHGFKLGNWLSSMRKKRESLEPSQVERLNGLGFQWESSYQIRWDASYEEAKRFYKEHGHLKVPQGYLPMV